MIELEQSLFPNQLKPDRSDSWAIVFSSGGPELCTTQHMVNQDLFNEYAAKLINPETPPPPPLPHEIHTLAQDRKVWKHMEGDFWHHWEPQ